MLRRASAGGGFGRRETAALFAVLAVLLAACSFVDLPLSESVCNPASSFGLFFAAFGPLGGGLTAVFCAAALLVVYRPHKSAPIRTALLALLLAGCSAYAAATPLSYLGFSLWLAPPIAVTLACAGVLLARHTPVEYRARLGCVSRVGLLLFASESIAVRALKWLWGRWRFEAMAPPYAHFTPWYLPHPFAAGNARMSFPSGHASEAAVIVWILLLPEFLPGFARRKWLPRVIAYGWTGLTMASRVVLGAHFGSDVVCGAALTFGLFALFSKSRLSLING